MRTERDITTHAERGRSTEADTVRESRWEMAPGQIVSLIAGVGFIAIGLVAVLRAGLDGGLTEPVVEVLGFSHTAWLGLAELGLGILLLLAGSSIAGRSLSVVLGALMVIGGVVIMAVPEDLPAELGLEKDYGMPLLLIGAIVAIAALVLPAWNTHRVDREVVDLH